MSEPSSPKKRLCQWCRHFKPIEQIYGYQEEEYENGDVKAAWICIDCYEGIFEGKA